MGVEEEIREGSGWALCKNEVGFGLLGLELGSVWAREGLESGEMERWVGWGLRPMGLRGFGRWYRWLGFKVFGTSRDGVWLVW